MKDKLAWKYIFILIVIFISFYFVTTLLLDEYKRNEDIEDKNPAIKEEDSSYVDEKGIINNLYNEVRMLYDVVNVKFKVSQEDVIVIDNITYKKITNFDDVVNGIFTINGVNKYVSDLGAYFAHTEGDYYIAGNLVSYQTYYFRGDNTNIFIIDAKENEIKAIIYEKWTSGNKNTLATIKVIKDGTTWLIDDISILSSE